MEGRREGRREGEREDNVCRNINERPERK